MSEEDPELVRLMIDYFYRLDYNHLSGKNESNGNAVKPRPEPDVEPVVEPTAESIPEIILIDSPTLEDPSVDFPANDIPDESDQWRMGRLGKKSKRKNKRSLSFGDFPEPSDSQLSGLTTHAQMYSLADRYGIGGLKSLAQQKFKPAARRYWASQDFAPAVHIVYTSTPDEDRGLRDIVTETIDEHRNLIKKPEMEMMVKDLPLLAFDLLKHTWAKEIIF